MDDVIRRIPLVGGGVLLAVLWFDLIFDAQTFGKPPGVLPEEVLASIAGYYERVVVAASPMGSGVAVVMVATLLAIGRQIQAQLIPRKLAVASLFLAAPPIALGMLRIVPNAARLGGRSDTLEVQSALARSIAVEHVLCLVAIVLFTAVQLAAARASRPAAAQTETGGEA